VLQFGFATGSVLLMLNCLSIFNFFFFFSGEGFTGALVWNELFSLAHQIGFEIPRIVKASSLEVTKPELKKVLGKF